jgi:hypothetical protein
LFLIESQLHIEKSSPLAISSQVFQPELVFDNHKKTVTQILSRLSIEHRVSRNHSATSKPKLQSTRRAAFHACRLIAGCGSLNAKVALGYRFAIAREADNSKRTNNNAELTTDTQIRVNQHRTFRILAVN